VSGGASRLLRFDPGGFDDTRRVFTLAQHESCELRLRHDHRIGPMLRQPLLNRCADADFGGVFFDLVLAVEVRNARLSVGGADRSKDEMYACCLGGVGGGDTLSYLSVRSSERCRHREERRRSFERLDDRGSVFKRCCNERRTCLREQLRLP
jgi:hypothetical protein